MLQESLSRPSGSAERERERERERLRCLQEEAQYVLHLEDEQY
jgi:hypothetical protein